MKNLLPNECFDLHPGKRLEKTREYVNSLSLDDRSRIEETLREKLTLPHCAYAIPAWGLMVLPGPGGEQSDPSEEHCDWTPGLGEPSRHFAEFPAYVAHYYPPSERNKRGMWHGMRATIQHVDLPGVRFEDRFACWGLINLTTEHAPSEAVRRTTSWDLETAWRLIEICRPRLIIAPPSQMGGGRCYDRVQRLLREKGASPRGPMKSYRGDRGSRTWDFRWWLTSWGKCRVGKMHTQPSYWGGKVTTILTDEARNIAFAAKMEPAPPLRRTLGSPAAKRASTPRPVPLLHWGNVLGQLEELIEIVRLELPPSCKGARVTRSKARVSLDVPPPFYRLTDSRKLVKMFVRKTQGVHVMVPPDLDLESRGWSLHEKQDSAGDQKLLWPFEEAETLAQKLGKDLATFL